MRLTFGNVLFLVLVVAGVAFAAAPWFAFRSLRDAARTGDTQALAQLVDYNAVRHGIADQLSDQPAAAQAPAPDIWHDPLGALKHVFSAPPAPPQPQIDTYLSPTPWPPWPTAARRAPAPRPRATSRSRWCCSGAPTARASASPIPGRPCGAPSSP
ncbi:MAG: DUF2939 domain-containing protein [Caulobacteraceae bacterium]